LLLSCKSIIIKTIIITFKDGSGIFYLHEGIKRIEGIEVTNLFCGGSFKKILVIME